LGVSEDAESPALMPEMKKTKTHFKKSADKQSFTLFKNKPSLGSATMGKQKTCFDGGHLVTGLFVAGIIAIIVMNAEVGLAIGLGLAILIIIALVGIIYAIGELLFGLIGGFLTAIWH
jgi:hypothetical protein